MKTRNAVLGVLFLAGWLSCLPATSARPQEDRQDEQRYNADLGKRFYDEGHKDYHNWDANEDRAWRDYQTDQHQKYRDFSKAGKKEQANYWKWRHDHPDSDRR